MLAFDSSCGYPGEGPQSKKQKTIHQCFASTAPPKPTSTASTTAPEPSPTVAATAMDVEPQLVQECVSPMLAEVDLTADMLSESGRFIAVYDAKLDRWSICSRTEQCKMKRIGSRKSREDAIDDLQLLEAGTHKSQTKAAVPSIGTRTSERASATTATHVPHAQVREGNWKAGTGRGNKLPPQSQSQLDLEDSKMQKAQLLLKDGCQDPSKLRASLQMMVDYATQLKQRCRALVSKVATLSRLVAGSASEQCVLDESTKHQLTRELIGTGYPSNTGSTLRLHRLAVMRSLQAVCGDDQVKQYEVACAVVKLFRQNSSKKDRKAAAANAAVVKGLEATFAPIAERSVGETGRGRLKLKDRIVHEVLTTALMMAVPDGVTINSLKTALGDAVDWRALEVGQQRAEAFKAGTGEAFQLEESSTGGYDEEWAAFVKQCWHSATRESERKSDERWCSQEKRYVKIRWLEQRLTGVLQYIRVAGAAKFEGFRLSWGKMLQLMPKIVRRPGRQTCMCRYHMDFQEFCDALRRWKQSAQKEMTPAQAKQCIPAPSSAQEMRQKLQCPKEGGFYKPECCMRHRIKPGCNACRGKLSEFICDAEREAKPTITYQKWSDVPYNCKDGRVLTTHDFMAATVPIAEFEQSFSQCITTFLPHHTRAQVADQEWDYLWDHVHEFPNSIGINPDFSNSYLHKHKYEHMQQFWYEVSTTLLVL